jgi:hypothetical protein
VKDFLRVIRAKHQSNELGEDVRLRIEILKMVVLISYRHLHPFPLSTALTWANTEQQLAERRSHWLSARQGHCISSDQEVGICAAYDGFCAKAKSPGQNKPAYPTLGDISPLFFTISAKFASHIGQGISEHWMELAGQLMLQAALESCLMPSGTANRENPLALSFAWGWLPPRFWDDIDSSDELLVNYMFSDNDNIPPGENQAWQKTRLKYMSLFSVPRAEGRVDRHALSTHLTNLARDHPLEDLEKQMVMFLKSVWEILRMPLLVQIERGGVDGMTKAEFEEFKTSAFIPL